MGFFFFSFFFVLFCFVFVCLFVCGVFGPHPQHMKTPGPGIKPEPLQWQCQILNLFCLRELLACSFFFPPSKCVHPNLPYSFWSISLCKPLSFFCLSFLSFVLLGMHPWHMEVPRLRVESELLLPAYARATATPDPSHICYLHHSSWQRRILNPLMEGRDRTHNLMVPSWISFRCTTTGIPSLPVFLNQIVSGAPCSLRTPPRSLG